VNTTSTGLFKEGSFLYLGTDKFKCKNKMERQQYAILALDRLYGLRV
jgi:hypothetical protein